MNNKINDIIRNINIQSGIEFESTIVSNTDSRLNVMVRDARILKGRGFVINLKLLNARVQVDIQFESIAKNILIEAFKRMKLNHKVIEKFIESNRFVRDVNFFFNDRIKSLIEISELEEHIISDLRIQIFTGLIDLDDIEIVIGRVFDLIVPLLLLIMPYEEDKLGQVEGKLKESLFTTYERSKKNRTLCLSFYGYDCQACGQNMEEKYGVLGKGFIHVHHIEPLHLSGIKKINPFEDLIPLCPNCHAIVHRESPPISVERLKEILNNEYTSKSI